MVTRVNSLRNGSIAQVVLGAHSANTRRWSSVGSMLGQRRRRWANIYPILGRVSCLLYGFPNGSEYRPCVA